MQKRRSNEWLASSVVLLSVLLSVSSVGVATTKSPNCGDCKVEDNLQGKIFGEQCVKDNEKCTRDNKTGYCKTQQKFNSEKFECICKLAAAKRGCSAQATTLSTPRPGGRLTFEIDKGAPGSFIRLSPQTVNGQEVVLSDFGGTFEVVLGSFDDPQDVPFAITRFDIMAEPFSLFGQSSGVNYSTLCEGHTAEGTLNMLTGRFECSFWNLNYNDVYSRGNPILGVASAWGTLNLEEGRLSISYEALEYLPHMAATRIADLDDLQGSQSHLLDVLKPVKPLVFAVSIPESSAVIILRAIPIPYYLEVLGEQRPHAEVEDLLLRYAIQLPQVTASDVASFEPAVTDFLKEQINDISGFEVFAGYGVYLPLIE